MNRHTAAILLVVLTARLAVCQDSSPAKRVTNELFRITPPTPRAIQELFRYSPEPLPIVSAHRGGAQQGFPENCIPTFENTLRHTFALLEIDPRYTQDREIVVLHDATLERTTTGKGKVADFTLKELKLLRLKDPEGKATDFQIPTLDEVLIWARDKTVLVLDQKDVPVAARVKKIAEHKAESYTIVIVYSFQEAQECFALNPSLLMEVMIPNQTKLAEFGQLEIPWRNVVAFVGHNPPTDLTLYSSIHAKGARCLIGTSCNLDRKVLTGEATRIRDLDADYRAFLKRGADLIETDIPAQLGPLLYGEAAEHTPAGVLHKPE